MAVSPDGSRIVSGGDSRYVKVWDAGTGTLDQRCGKLKGHKGSVQSVAWSPDEQTIVSGSEDMTVKLWDANTGNLKASLEGHANRVWAVTFSPDGRLGSVSVSPPTCVLVSSRVASRPSLNWFTAHRLG